MSSTAPKDSLQTRYDEQVRALQGGRFKDPFSFLGAHAYKNGYEIRVYLPAAKSVSIFINDKKVIAKRYNHSDLFIATSNEMPAQPYKCNVEYENSTLCFYDEYSFASSLDTDAMYLFNEGSLEHAYKHLGAHFINQQGVDGVRFCVWAPNAASVSVIGEFNLWQANRHYMRFHPACGVWEIFIAGLQPDTCYKFSIVTQQGDVLEKADPFAFKMQQAPGTASVLQQQAAAIMLSDSELKNRQKRNHIDAPISIYEVHLGSWQRAEENRYLSYSELADKLVNYTLEMGFTHIQLMPISEYPFDGSWGYQPVGLFAPTSRFGDYSSFKYFVQQCHKANLGVLLDWVPGHFPSDPHGLHHFDGTHLFEHADIRQGFHPDWNTYIYNYDRPEVKSFLISNAMYWLEQFGLDGLRVDAVASMLYLDYSRKEGQWVANCYGGRENLGAIECLKQVNLRSYKNNPGIMMVAEESTAWPGVTQSVDHNGLGFGYKWNMGWMNDSLHYMKYDPLYRQHHHHEMTFSMVYAFSENYILPLSHDEVVHGKGSLIEKMPGDDWQKFANLRAYYAFMWAHPGKKLLFMGGEIAQRKEWDHNHSIDWHLLEHKSHRGMQNTVQALNTVYVKSPALYELDSSPAGFEWIDNNNNAQSIFSFVRYAKNAHDFIVVVANFTPVSYQEYEIGVPAAGKYKVILNTDDDAFFGSGIKATANNNDTVSSFKASAHGFSHSIKIAMGGLTTIYLQKVEDE
ncbi:MULTISPECIES: 1,4-alpha-glucan branching protein GlgB [unclassified Pseudoalteromonas]|uniref:1,4-alpha-glucan branching protein GlgB n=1 Tax=unclassified Pseudoalteromonas TaxID=194690 RepID=UPI0006D66232|nr:MULTISPECIES: 1,4-alpha-glucan branching protein GlgB [unclassified Pseudoalteromonas]KPZ58465.1 1,4-alpha-glucan branching enzyme GlgB [Pseudoalteromonas sp. P1-25]KPZ60633.1 1,4-alpha-glucan branching enzyme GlgB [Pseudoalteromonas sp. P1-13-1a]